LTAYFTKSETGDLPVSQASREKPEEKKKKKPGRVYPAY